MALASAVKGGLRPAQIITWSREDGNVETLTGATLTGFIRDRTTGTTRAIAGTLTVTNGAAGEFRWDYAAADVADVGYFDVQFNAAYGSGLTPAKTFIARWDVKEALAVSA
jgi:hypothetical protein